MGVINYWYMAASPTQILIGIFEGFKMNFFLIEIVDAVDATNIKFSYLQEQINAIYFKNFSYIVFQ